MSAGGEQPSMRDGERIMAAVTPAPEPAAGPALEQAMPAPQPKPSPALPSEPSTASCGREVVGSIQARDEFQGLKKPPLSGRPL